MSSEEIKNKILQKINGIEDEVLLQYIQDFLDASDKYYTKKTKDLDLTNEDESKDTPDFTEYIKEWIKDM